MDASVSCNQFPPTRMGEAGSRGKYPTDLLQRFLCSNSHEAQVGAFKEDEDEIELNLGLSLGGRFEVDKNSKKLLRSSSIAGTMPLSRDDEGSTPAAVAYPVITRTSSLPVETEEEWRKRKELQSLRRMEAKRRRFEKQRNKDGIGMGSGQSEGLTGLNLREKRDCSGISTVAPPFGLPMWAGAARQVLVGGTGDVIAKGKGGSSGDGLPVFGQPASQCSAESHGGSSSGTSELDSKHIQGSNSCGEARSSSQERGPEAVGLKTLENPCRNSKPETKIPSKKPDSGENKGRETGTGTRSTSMKDMPCVFTIGDGPEGRRVDGILYKYGKGEEVRIMCVCHEISLSPAEFVKHAGGKNMAHPLRHIVVNPNSVPFL